MTVRQQVLSGAMPSSVISELLRNGISRQQASESFVREFPEVDPGAILGYLRRLGSTSYSQYDSNISALDFLILREMHDAGLPVRVPAEPE